MTKIHTFIFFLSLFLFALTKNQKYIDIIITKETDRKHTKEVGQNGFFYMVTDTKNLSMFNRSDIEKWTKFNGVFESDNHSNITVPNCSLWSPENMNIVVICPFTSDFNSSEKYTLIEGYISFQDYRINIWSRYYFDFDVKESSSKMINLSPENYVIIRLKLEDNRNMIKMGYYGTLYLVTNYDDIDSNIFDSSDIEELTRFDSYITDKNMERNYSVHCRLWKPNGEKLRVFCNFNMILYNDFNNITFGDAQFVYKNYTVFILSNDIFVVQQMHYDFPLFYSEKQEISIENGVDLYKFNFKYDDEFNSFNSITTFYIYQGNSYISLDNCTSFNNKELTCEITKEKLEENLVLNDSTAFDFSFIHNYYGSMLCDNVLDIKINYIPSQEGKENIYIEITKLLNEVSELGVEVAYETNITSLPNLLTDIFKMTFYDLLDDNYSDGFCYFKKTSEKAMILLCNIQGEGDFYILEKENNTVLNNINYKYNFIINPFEIHDIIKVAEIGTDILLTYPRVLNFTLEDSLTIKYLMSSPSLAEEIKLNPEAPKLYCSSKNDLKTCTVPMSHFSNLESGYYYTYHLNHLNESSIYYASTPFKIILRDEFTLLISVASIYHSSGIDLGKKGTIVYVTDYNDDIKNIFNISDIEEKTEFNAVLSNSNNENHYNVICRLWKPLNENINIFCNLKYNDTLVSSSENLIMNLVEFKYNNYTIIIQQTDYITIRQLNYELSFIYAYPQDINIEEEKEFYELKFKADLYIKDDKIYLTDNQLSYIVLDNCNLNKKDLTCKLGKNLLGENLVLNNSKYQLGLMNMNTGASLLSKVGIINITIKESDKIDIYVQIENPLGNIVPYYSVISYETKYKEKISNLRTNYFPMTFVGVKMNRTKDVDCYFKKVDGQDLQLLCTFFYVYDDSYYLQKVTEEIFLKNINYKYNFIIIPFENNEVISVNYLQKGSNVQLTYPTLLNFTLEESLNISYIMNYASRVENIKLNPDSNELICFYNGNLKKCYVPLEHFIGKKDGYYFTNYNYNYTLFDASPFNVILPPDDLVILRIKAYCNNKGILIGNNGSLYFNTDYDDSIKSIFDNFEIEEKTRFNSTIMDKELNEYNVQCHLWKQSNNKLSIFCNLNERLKYQKQDIILNMISFKYNNYTVIIYPKDYINTTRLDHNIPFLYADEQLINIEEEKNEYEIKFKYGNYYDDILYLYGNYSNYVALDNCEINYLKKEVVCKIIKEKLEEKIIAYNDSFKLGSMNDNYGLLNFDYVSNINIYYSKYINPSIKENINVSFSRIIEHYSELGGAFYIETNINSIPNLITLYFRFCQFKKTMNNPLIFICYPESETDYFIGNNSKVIPLTDIHYKYNFFLQPFDLNDKVQVRNKGTTVNLVYPQELNLINEKKGIIRYIMPNPQFEKNIKLNPDSDSYLECEDLIGMKKCTIPVLHFEEKENDYYYTYHLNHLNEYSIYYEANPIKIILAKWKIEIGIEDKDNQNPIKIGQKGVLYFVTNYKDTENIFDEENSFKADFTDSIGNKIYNTDCILWKPKDENMRIICQLNENMEKDDQIIYMIKTSFIYKEDYNITINYKAVNINVKQLKSEISFLYYSKQEIEIKDNVEEYQLVFKQFKYDNRPLYLYKNDIRAVLLDNCKSESKEVTCNVNKNKLVEILSYSGENYSLAEKIETEGLYIFNSVLNISFNYNIEQKDIKIKIGNLLTPYVYKNEFIAYEVITENNVTRSITTDYFDLGREQNSLIKCIFKKSDNHDNLFLLCNAINAGKNSLGKISSATKDNINIFYKFLIEQSENNEEFDVSNEQGTKITSLSPLLLNFTEKDNYTLIYETEYPEKLDGIKLNNLSSFDLKCTDKPWYKECMVNKTHFTKSDYYYTLHSNHKGAKTISYEVPMINVIIKEEPPNPKPSENDDTNYGLIIGLSIAAVIIIILIIFLLWKYLQHKKKKEEKDPEKEKLVGVNDIIVSQQVKEGINQSRATEYGINA